MKPKAQYGDAIALPIPYYVVLHMGYAMTATDI